MALTDYSGLKAAVANWLNRGDLTSQIPDFIELTEAKLRRELKTRRMINRSTTSVNEEYEPVPGDYAGAVTFKLTDWPEPLVYLTPVQMDEKASGSAGTTSRPGWYAIYGDQFRFYPAPDQSYAAELVYYQGVSALSDDNPTNWILTDHPDAYLYGALCEAAPYLRDDDRVLMWRSMFKDALRDIKTASIVESYGALRPDFPL